MNLIYLTPKDSAKTSLSLYVIVGRMGGFSQLRQVLQKAWNRTGGNGGCSVSKRLFLIDGNSLINRAFYALPPLTNQAGQPTNAVYGLTRMLFRLQDDYNPDQIVVTFDVSGGPTFRHEQYKEYKAGRRPMPDDLRLQIPVMKDILDALGIARLELEGYEADDLLGTVSLQGGKKRDLQCLSSQVIGTVFSLFQIKRLFCTPSGALPKRSWWTRRLF